VIDQKLEVRLLNKNDKILDSLFKIDQDAFHENSLNIWALMTYIQYGRIFGLFADGCFKGFIIFMRSWDDSRLAYLKKIAVDEESRNKGYGSYLLSKSLGLIKKDGISSVVLTVDPNNSAGMHVYQEKFGFQPVEFRKNEYGPGRDRWYMRLDLENFVENK
jgi:[ribosomal protein S18]-alanine N-acetyltransferase